MTTFSSWGDALTTSFQNLWVRLVDLVPTVLGAIIIFFVGLFVASAVGRLVTKIIRMLKIDAILDKTGLPKKISEMGVKFSLSTMIGWVVKWFLIVLTLISVADFLNWTQITTFLNKVALYIPNVLVAVIILIIGLLIGRYVHDVVQGAVTASRLPTSSASMLAKVAEWAIVIFAVLAALTQLGIASRLIEIFFTGLIAALALAFGLAFGLGGREKAGKLLEKVNHVSPTRE